MNIYISGISGTGLGPLALMALDAGIHVTGSDRAEGAITGELRRNGIDFYIGDQDGNYLQKKFDEEGIDWFVYTSALPEDHPELLLAGRLGIRCSKRDELTAHLVEKLGLEMIAVAGTHGKTTTVSMLTWAALRLGLPAAYLVGTTINFAPSGSYKRGDRFFLYEADEYDRNFLNYHPSLSVITFVSYDHQDIYPTEADYRAAFEQFEAQSGRVIFAEPGAAPDDMSFLEGKDTEIIEDIDPRFTLSGKVKRRDATAALHALKKICDAPDEELIDILNAFPGVGRRFEKLADGIYTDYAHHPEEIEATVEIASEEASALGKKGVAVIYQPHQNARQHKVKAGYKNAFLKADKIYWLPTYLVREDPNLAVLSPEELISRLSNSETAEAAGMDDGLIEEIRKCLKEDLLVVLMSAGPADKWLRDVVKEKF